MFVNLAKRIHRDLPELESRKRGTTSLSEIGTIQICNSSVS
jgi:hypothetical protein